MDGVTRKINKSKGIRLHLSINLVTSLPVERADWPGALNVGRETRHGAVIAKQAPSES